MKLAGNPVQQLGAQENIFAVCAWAVGPEVVLAEKETPRWSPAGPMNIPVLPKEAGVLVRQVEPLQVPVVT